MSEAKKINFYKSIIGDAKSTIDAIQKFIADNSPKKNTKVSNEETISSIDRVLNSVSDEEISKDIKKIIENL